MSSVFLSYDREDLDRARPVALALEKAGHVVWWDRQIAGGAQYSKEIEQALKQTDVVVVLWSQRSVESPWVRDEAAAGRDMGCLVPVTLDGTTPPLGFRQYQTVDLSIRKGRSRPAAQKELVRAIDACTGVKSTAEPPPSASRAAAAPRISARALLIAFAVVLAAALSFVGWQRWEGKAATPLVAVAAIDSSGNSRALARDLLIKLGTLQTGNTDVLRLAEANSADRADLILEAGAGTSRGQTEASLALLAGSDRSLLWSKQFEQPLGKEAELRQQLAVTAGRALDCALQALSDKRTKLSPQLLKLYLNGCAGFDELAYEELRRMIPVMRQVTQQAPKFEGAWGRLIMAELLAGIAAPDDPTLLPLLRQHIAEARRFHPHLAESYLAEVELLPEDAIGERLRLIELAIRHNPNHPEPPAARSYYLRFVGRMSESAQSAKRGADLNPLSPALRRDYITALAAAGQIDRAKQELERAEQLWPGSSVIADARLRFNLGHGDQRVSPLWTPRYVETFIKARTVPTPSNIEAAIREAQALTRQDPRAIGVLVETLGAFNREEALFPLLLNHPQTAFQGSILEVLFRPSMREFWHDPRSMMVAKRLQLVDYWRTSGKWPDFCFEPDLPYDCKQGAAKLS